MNGKSLRDIAKMERWLTICCKPRQELVAQENLLQQGFRVYFPLIKVKKHRQGKWVDVVEALFPRYIFIQVNPFESSISPVRSTRGVVGLVSFGGQPAVVADDVMDTLFRRADQDSGLHQDNHPFFSAGEPVKLLQRPLAGMEGIFIQKDGENRVIVLLELLGKANKVRIDRDLVTKVA